MSYNYPPPAQPYPPPMPPPPKSSHRLRNTLLIVVSMLVVAGITAAGVLLATGDNNGDADAASPSPIDESLSVDAEAELLEQQRQLVADCRREVGAWLRTLHNVDSRLSIGMTQTEYSDALGEVQIAYDRLNLRRADVSCVSQVGIPAEKAFNQYVKANNRWSDCIVDLYCDLDADAMPAIQERWARATVLLDRADRNLRNLGQTGSSVS